MKWAAFAAFLVWVIPISQTPRQPSQGVIKKQGTSDAQLTADSRDKQQAAETATLNAILAAITKDEQERANESQQEAANVQSTVSAEWWLVGVGIAQTLALIGTLLAVWYQAKKTADSVRAIERQAGIMEQQTAAAVVSASATQRSADAALLNAKVAINSERPWLLIPIGEQGVGAAIQKPYLVPVEQDMGKRFTHCIFYIKNYGDTPGRVFASKVMLQLGDSPVAPPNVWAYDVGDAEHNVVTVPPHESIASEAILTPLGIIKAEDQQKVLQGGKYLWLCGFIKYRDTFERENAPEYETRFCYLYENRFNSPEPFWKATGADQYNRAT